MNGWRTSLVADSSQYARGVWWQNVSEILKPQMELTLKFGQAHRMETRWKKTAVHQVATDKRLLTIVIKSRSYLPNQKTSNNWIKNTLINISWIFILNNFNRPTFTVHCGDFFRQESCWNAAAIAESPQGLAVMSPLKLTANAPEKLGRIQGGEIQGRKMWVSGRLGSVADLHWHFLMLEVHNLASKIIPSEGAHVQQTAFEGGIFFAWFNGVN